MDLFEESYPKWQSCEHPDPAVKALCADLSIWVSGEMSSITAALLEKEETAKQFCGGHAVLYRGFCLTREHRNTLSKKGWFDIESQPDQSLASWSSDAWTARDFMFGFESFHVVMRKAGLDEFCDLVLFDREAKPFTKMRSQDEIIVKMPPVMRITRRDIVYRSDRPEDLRV